MKASFIFKNLEKDRNENGLFVEMTWKKIIM